jgi:osmotically-inducible protein OsmY
MPQQQTYPALFRDGSFSFVAGRTDAARLTEMRLRGSSYPELRSVRCDFHEGVLTLRGTVSSFYTTQLAQALAARIPGVEEVVNHIEVKETATCSSSADK